MSVDEHSPQESSQETDQPAVRVVSGYCATRRTARKHKRVIRQGTELFDADVAPDIATVFPLKKETRLSSIHLKSLSKVSEDLLITAVSAFPFSCLPHPRNRADYFHANQGLHA